MERIAISCDSTCAIPRSEAEKLGIFILPLNVIVDEVEYHDGIDIDNQKLAKMMRKGALIKTSTPTYGELEEYFGNIIKQGYDHIIHITISSKLTSIFNMTTQFCNEYYEGKVTVIDSLSVCSFMGSIVKYAKNLEQSGNDVSTITNKVKEHIGKEEISFIPESLTYLKRGGRISPAIATLGNMIGLKPVLKFENGSIEKSRMTRVVKKEFINCLEELKSKNYDPRLYDLHIIHFDCDSLTEFVFEQAMEILPEFSIIKSDLSINVCAHAGPGTIAVGVTLKSE